jgi:periplasmic divalent cation tolerance protein
MIAAPTIDSMSEHALVLITVGDRGEATAIAGRLVADRLAAGVQMVPIESSYTWEGEVVEDHEVLLIAKTRADRFEAIRELVVELHSYEVPPVIRIDIAEAHLPYLRWIDEVVDGPKTD